MRDLVSRLSAALGDRCEIERELGRGGAATVFAVRDARHGRTVALKVMDVGYVMPLMEGRTLRDRLREASPLPVDEALRIADSGIARPSSFRFKGASLSLHAIAESLSVANVVEGSVRREGNTLRITLRLVHVPHTGADSTIWSDEYTRRLLRTLLPTDRAALAVRSASSPEAYDRYLKGRYHWYRRDTQSLLQAITFYRQALAIDSGCAQAWAGLADAHSLLPWSGGRRPVESRPLATAAIHASSASSPGSDCDEGRPTGPDAGSTVAWPIPRRLTRCTDEEYRDMHRRAGLAAIETYRPGLVFVLGAGRVSGM